MATGEFHPNALWPRDGNPLITTIGNRLPNEPGQQWRYAGIDTASTALLSMLTNPSTTMIPRSRVFSLRLRNPKMDIVLHAHCIDQLEANAQNLVAFVKECRVSGR